ncbi:MAG: hypothetical protein AAB505_02175, partial [Patescibacteria group bacterium]
GLRVPTAFVASEPVTGRTLQQIAFSENQEAADHGIAPILVVSIKEVDEGLSLLDWVRSFGIAESDMQIVTIGSRQFIKWFDSIGGGLGSTSYSTIFSDNRVININMPAPSLVGTSPSLEVITSSLKLSLSPEWKTVTLMNDEISITYPPTLVLVPNGDNRIILKDATESGSSPPDGSPTISVRVEPNPDHLSMESYYDGQHGVFVGPSTGTIAVGNRIGHVFVPTETMSGDVIVIVPLPSGDFLFVADRGQAFQQNGVFDSILATIKFSADWPTATSGDITLNYPPDWNVEVFPQTIKEEGTIVIHGREGSKTLILPAGGFPYDIDPEINLSEQSLVISEHPAIRADYRDSMTGKLLFVRVVFSPPLPQAPELRVEFHPNLIGPNEEETFAQILQTLKIDRPN